jgi:hypothetical protein
MMFRVAWRVARAAYGSKHLIHKAPTHLHPTHPFTHAPELWLTSAVHASQEAGETLFVPSCWHHSVENIEDTLSINQNWFNGFALGRVWAHLHGERAAAEAAIADCRALCRGGADEFEGLVQRNTAANAGMDWFGFGELLRCIVGSSLRQLAGRRGGIGIDGGGGSGSGTAEGEEVGVEVLRHVLRLRQCERGLEEVNRAWEAVAMAAGNGETLTLHVQEVEQNGQALDSIAACTFML